MYTKFYTMLLFFKLQLVKSQSMHGLFGGTVRYLRAPVMRQGMISVNKLEAFFGDTVNIFIFFPLNFNF